MQRIKRLQQQLAEEADWYRIEVCTHDLTRVEWHVVLQLDWMFEEDNYGPGGTLIPTLEAATIYCGGCGLRIQGMYSTKNDPNECEVQRQVESLNPPRSSHWHSWGKDGWPPHRIEQDGHSWCSSNVQHNLLESIHPNLRVVKFRQAQDDQGRLFASSTDQDRLTPLASILPALTCYSFWHRYLSIFPPVLIHFILSYAQICDSDDHPVLTRPSRSPVTFMDEPGFESAAYATCLPLTSLSSLSSLHSLPFLPSANSPPSINKDNGKDSDTKIWKVVYHAHDPYPSDQQGKKDEKDRTK